MHVEKAQENTLVLFEQALNEQDYKKAEQHLQEILLHLNVHQSFSKTQKDGINLLPFTSSSTEEERLQYYRMVTEKITQLLYSEDYEISDFGFQVFNIFKSQLLWLYIAAGYVNLDGLLVAKGIIDPKNQHEFNLKTTADLKLLLTCYTIESDFSLDFDMLYQSSPMLASYTYVGCFYYSNIILTEKSEHCLSSLIKYHSIFTQLPLDNTLLILCANIWMTCTYMNASEKHKIKGAINDYYLRYLNENLSKKTKQRTKTYLQKYRKNTEKQKLVICAEVLSSGHAMVRCYLPALQALAEKFDTVLVVSKGLLDESVKNIFGRIIEVEDKTFGQHDDIVNIILDEQPDILYYPSLGMACWTLPLCNLRLAPVQIMSLGHPASSMSKAIDYYLTDEDSKEFLLDTIEKPHIIPNNHVYFARDLDFSLLSKAKHADDVVHIAVNCKDFKIRPVFIETCSELAKASSKKCVFHFFPNAKGLMRDCFDNLLKSQLTNYEVHRVADYQEYMNQLSKCNLSLSTFPFGGSNSNIDAFLLGIPRVIYISPGPEGCSDLTQAKLINLPDWLITNDIQQYYLAALALIESDLLRKEVSEQIQNSEPEKVFFEQQNEAQLETYPKAFCEIYQQHRYDNKKKYNRNVCY